MKVVRFNVFETNSSSTHSLSLITVERKFTKIGKLESGKKYNYEPMGEKKVSKYKKNQSFVFSSEYEKMCALIDLLFLDLSNKLFSDFSNKRLLIKYKKSSNDCEFDLFNRYVLNSLLKGNYYRELKMVFNKHNIQFEIDKDVFDKSSKMPIYCESLEMGNFDFMGYFINFGFQSVGETINEIVFNPRYKLEVQYFRH